MKSMAWLISTLLISVAISGCISEPETADNTEPEGYFFTAKTLDRTVDGGPYLNLAEAFQDGPKILLWISTGCYGCHDWTDEIYAGIENGSLSNQSVISIHRYSTFESMQSLHNVYGSLNNSTHPTSWPVLIPDDNTPVVDANTGLIVKGTTVFEAYDFPVTPTLQVVNQQGIVVWTSDEYRPTQFSLDGVIKILNQHESSV